MSHKFVCETNLSLFVPFIPCINTNFVCIRWARVPSTIIFTKYKIQYKTLPLNIVWNFSVLIAWRTYLFNPIQRYYDTVQVVSEFVPRLLRVQSYDVQFSVIQLKEKHWMILTHCNTVTTKKKMFIVSRENWRIIFCFNIVRFKGLFFFWFIQLTFETSDFTNCSYSDSENWGSASVSWDNQMMT